MEGSGEDADRCSCCGGSGALPLLGWKMGYSLRRRRELAELFDGPIGEL